MCMNRGDSSPLGRTTYLDFGLGGLSYIRSGCASWTLRKSAVLLVGFGVVFIPIPFIVLHHCFGNA